jgi:CRISPR/Cas system Type II protein with McrA/HNH and RuvC-like nuclease domain
VAILKKLRFEVFKRDGFKCSYCGKTPPEVTLEVDHINPKAEGGDDDINNLLAACFDCNRGKSCIVLEKIPNQLSENIEILKEKQCQMREYENFLAEIKADEKHKIKKIDAMFTTVFKDYSLSDNFMETSLRHFVKSLPFPEVEEAMQIAMAHRPLRPQAAIKYFCGVCWRKIKGVGYAEKN